MSTTVDNITLAVLSLRDAIKLYLDSNDWQNRYNCFLAGDPDLFGKEMVLKVVDKSKQIGLPIIIVDDRSVRNEVTELGTYGGSDMTDIEVTVIASDNIQLRTLSNVLRRYMTDLTFSIYNYSLPVKKSVGTAYLSGTFLTNISDWSSVAISERYQNVVNSVMETSFDNLI